MENKRIEYSNYLKAGISAFLQKRKENIDQVIVIENHNILCIAAFVVGKMNYLPNIFDTKSVYLVSVEEKKLYNIIDNLVRLTIKCFGNEAVLNF